MVDYLPRYPQPFTLAEAVHFEVSTITEEISRLQNSIARLKDTQEQLREFIDEDAELKAAFDENAQVIPAQEERITILKLALTEKGIVMGSHYASTPSSVSRKANIPEEQSSATEQDDSGGIHL